MLSFIMVGVLDCTSSSLGLSQRLGSLHCVLARHSNLTLPPSTQCVLGEVILGA